MPGNIAIIDGTPREVNPGLRLSTVGKSRLLVSMLLLALLVGCAESRAERRYRKAQRHVEQDRVEQAVQLLERIIEDYPDTEAARKARDDVGIYRSLLSAVRRYPVRRARDVVVQTARAIESFRARNRNYPASLDSLVSRYLPAVPVDPWDRPLRYRRKPGRRGYVLACYGEDGRLGGEGDASDLFVENGRFVTRLSGDPP